MVISSMNQLLIELNPCEYQGLVFWVPNAPENTDSLKREVISL